MAYLRKRIRNWIYHLKHHLYRLADTSCRWPDFHSFGVSDLKDGADTLSDASDDVVDGISELKDGAEDLKDGMQEFYDEGISKIKDLADENLTVILDRLKALTSDEISYDTYSGRSDSMNGSVKFIIETDEIE